MGRDICGVDVGRGRMLALGRVYFRIVYENVMVPTFAPVRCPYAKRLRHMVVNQLRRRNNTRTGTLNEEDSRGRCCQFKDRMYRD